MSADTPISWADHSLGIHYGCTKISAGCRHCYATHSVHRLQANPTIRYLTTDNPVAVDQGSWSGRIVFNPAALDAPRRTRRAARWFVSSLSDTFHPGVPDIEIAQVFAVAADCALDRTGHGPHHQFQLLTKRPERAAALLNDPVFVDLVDRHRRHQPHDGAVPWPLPNVWLGTTIEHNTTTHRADQLRATPAAIRWVSAEPLLGPLDALDLGGIDWVVAGGESDRGRHYARPLDLTWLRRLRDRCQAAGVAFHVKQLGSVQARTLLMTNRAGTHIGEFPARSPHPRLPHCSRPPGDHPMNANQLRALARRVTNQANGTGPTEAAAIIATQACRGWLLDRLAPWTDDQPDADMAWIDYRTALDKAKGLSSGERRLVVLAGSLATGYEDAVAVNLNDALTGLDDPNSLIVARAIAHALGLVEGQ